MRDDSYPNSETPAFDWWLLEYLNEHDPVVFGLLAHDLDEERSVLDDRLERLRERGLADFYFSSRPTQWGITDDGRACLVADRERNQRTYR